MKLAKIILLTISLVTFVAYEALAYYSHGADTVSEVIWRASTKHPVIPFMIGLLAGHLFWRA